MPAQSTLRVLLIEDNPADARLLQEMIRDVPDARLDIQHVELFAEALALLEKRPFDAALLDLSLPDSQWLGAFAQIHRLAPKLPVIVLTGLDDPRFSHQAVKQGAADYLLKGQITGQELVRAVRRTVDR